MPASADRELERRRAAAKRYKPAEIDLLLVAEAPSDEPDRYLYFEDVRKHDDLFRYVSRVLLRREPTRGNKRELLQQLCGRGAFLIDLKETPMDGTPHAKYVPTLVERCRTLRPRRIVLIKAPVFDAAYKALSTAGLPVVDVRIPFPKSGRQLEFVKAFGRAVQ